MTKQDYVRIVDDLTYAVRDAVASGDMSQEQGRAMASHFAHAFARRERTLNPRFDANRFFKAVQDATGADMAVGK